VFIGPCIAKKKEFQLGRTMHACDCVLTYEELFALFNSRDINLTELEESPLDEASGYGRSFARSGGVTEAVLQILKEKGEDPFVVKPVVCNGISACDMALLKLKVGKLEGNFIEGMACEGGCVQEPAAWSAAPRTAWTWKSTPRKPRPRAAPCWVRCRHLKFPKKRNKTKEPGHAAACPGVFVCDQQARNPKRTNDVSDDKTALLGRGASAP